MAKKSDKAKKKGPKGKRARAKAKLERQWGEEAVQDDPQAKQLRGRERKNRNQPKDATRSRGDFNDKNEQVQNHEMEEENNGLVDYHDKPVDNNNEEEEEDSDDEDHVKSFKVVSSFVDQLRRKHRKDLRHQQQQQSAEDIAGEINDKHESEDDDDDDEDIDEEDENDPMELQNEQSLDPFTTRFARAECSLSSAPNDPAILGPRKVSVPFVKEGTVVQFSHWPPPCWEALSPSLPANRHDWRRYARRLWQTQKLLLRQEPSPTGALGQVVYPLAATYMDICQTVPVPCNSRREETFQKLYASHILNHVWTSRQRIYQHSKELKAIEKSEDKEENVLEATQDPKFRDQGFTRPTVLVLLPTRGICYKFVQLLSDLLSDKQEEKESNLTNVLGERFVTEYGPPAEVDTDPRRQAYLQQKGKEWLSLFGDDVNDDDDFKLGVALHLHEKQKRPTLKLYTDFSKSDFILASPLGLKMWAAKRGKAQGGDDNDDDVNDMEAEPSAAPDYLSSIEICWLSHAHVLMMQNWDHVTDVLEWLNQRPQNTTDTDFSRIRPYFLEDDVSSAAWRQLILTAPYLDPCMKSAFGRHAKSVAGSARISRKTPWPDAALNKVTVPTRQVFQRIVVKSVQEQCNARLEYFGKNVLPNISKDQQPFTLIFIPDYLEFVSLRNYLIKKEADYFVSVTEYSRNTEVSRGRARFGQGRKSLMLYTGRAHFFHRHIIRGVRHVIWYGLPPDPKVYHQVVDWCEDESLQTQFSKEAPESSVLALYTAYEAHALERIVGHAHCSRMTKGDKTTFLFAA